MTLKRSFRIEYRRSYLSTYYTPAPAMFTCSLYSLPYNKTIIIEVLQKYPYTKFIKQLQIVKYLIEIFHRHSNASQNYDRNGLQIRVCFALESRSKTYSIVNSRQRYFSISITHRSKWMHTDCAKKEYIHMRPSSVAYIRVPHSMDELDRPYVKLISIYDTIYFYPL